MQAFLRRHAHKILVGHGAVIALLTTSMMVGVPKAIVYVTPTPEHLYVGDTLTLAINLHAKVPVNALGTTLVIPPEVEVVAMSKEGSFIDLWTEEAILREDARELRFSGGSLERGGVTGVKNALTLTVRARRSGEAVFSFKDTEVRAHDGTGNLVSTELRTLSITIADKNAEADSGGDTAKRIESPAADFDGKGGVTLTDMSILMMKLLGPYDARFDLTGDGQLSLADLSVLFSAMNTL